jgi:hypothetical protein
MMADAEFNQKVTYLMKLQNKFMKNEIILEKDEFPIQIAENFLKIVSNIYYLNTVKVWIIFKRDYLNQEIQDNKLIEKIYQDNLKATRKLVYNYFGVKNQTQIKAKYLVRMYPYSFEKNNPLKIKYFQITDLINKILINLQNKIIPEKFTSLSNEYVLEVQDVIIFIYFRISLI